MIANEKNIFRTCPGILQLHADSHKETAEENAQHHAA